MKRLEDLLLRSTKPELLQPGGLIPLTRVAIDVEQVEKQQITLAKTVKDLQIISGRTKIGENQLETEKVL